MLFPTLGSSKKGDPSCYVELFGKKRAILIDCGEHHFNNSKAKKITDILISHTHVDHFIGFDKILRVNLIDDKTINIYGPKGIIKNVEGKLAAYTWNITDQLKLKLNIYEISKNSLQGRCYNSNLAFKKKYLKSQKIKDNILVDDDDIEIRFTKLNHKIPSIAYSIQEKQSYNVNKAKLKEMEFTPGPWLGELKFLVGHKQSPLIKIEVKNKKYTVGFLKKELLLRKKGVKISYVTDTLYSKDSINKIIKIAKNSTYFVCETFFLECDKNRAKETCHLTTKQAATLAKRARVNYLIPFHLSKRYQNVKKVIDEVKKVFPNVR